MICEPNDFIHPMCADVYYSISTQGGFGEIKKQWLLDRTIACNAAPSARKNIEELDPKMISQLNNRLNARSLTDLRISYLDKPYSITDILITNIRDKHDNLIYKETSGLRSGKGTIYEIATIQPFVGAFGNVESYQMVWRRTESQASVD
jgi:hypothetical protein